MDHCPKCNECSCECGLGPRGPRGYQGPIGPKGETGPEGPRETKQDLKVKLDPKD